jgi:hypothetical protein
MSVTDKRIVYATLEPTNLVFGDPTTLTRLTVHPDERIAGPSLTIATDQIYVSWAEGAIRGSSDDGYYLSFAPGDIPESVPNRIVLPAPYPPDYVELNEVLPYRQLAAPLPATATAYRAGIRTAPSALDNAFSDGFTEEGLLGAGLEVRTRWSSRLQPALVVFEKGSIKGYQVVDWTRYPSLHPSLASDDEGNLYITWIDAAGQDFPVYLAATASGLRAAWDTPTGMDFAIALERLFGRAISALGLLVIGLSWIILPGFLLIFSLLIFREDSLRTRHGAMLLLILVFGLWAGKYLFTPDIIQSLPKLRDLPLIFPLLTLVFPQVLAFLPNQLALPAFVAPLVPYLVPGLTIVAGAGVARLAYLSRTRYPGVVPAFLIVAVVDLFLALQVYALNYYDPVAF